MVWQLLGAATGLTQSVSEVIGKKLQGVDRWAILAISTTIPIIAAWLVLAYTGLPSVPLHFWLLIAILGPLELLGAYAHLRAVQSAELSLTSPLANLTPALVLILSWLFAIEGTSIWGAAGVLLVVVGTILLTSTSPKGTIHALTHTGGKWMLLAAITWSITTILGKQAVLMGGVVFFLATALLVLATLCWIIVLFVKRGALATAKKRKGAVVSMGAINTVTVVIQNTTYLFAPAAYVVALKRTSTLWSLLWGRLIFKEQFGTRRVLAALIMFSGVLCIVLG